MVGTIKKDSVVVAVGTKKGGFLFHSADRRKWSVAGPFLAGAGVYHMGLDPRDGRTVYAAAPHAAEPWGPAVYRGRIGSEPKPTSSSPKFKEGSDLAVSRVWHIEPGSSNEPDTIYAGVEPAALFRSEDRGDTWEDFGALNYHPTRKGWQPGGGGLCLHSILVDPRKPKHLVIGISAVGAFESRDAGRSWTMENRGVRGVFSRTRIRSGGSVSTNSRGTPPATVRSSSRTTLARTTVGRTGVRGRRSLKACRRTSDSRLRPIPTGRARPSLPRSSAP